ncbi:MAG: two-component system response regulator CreB [Planctomycetota bacterium]
MTLRPRILVIEDEPAIADTIVYALETEGLEAIWCGTAEEGWSRLQEGEIDLVILDIGLPDRNGFELCRSLRKVSDVPVIFLTARTGEVDRVVGLELGADDYVVKPFSPRELSARAKAVLRRTRPSVPIAPRRAAPSVPFAVDAERFEIRYRDTKLELSRCEYRLLSLLIAHPGRVYSREQLMERAWDDPSASPSRTVDAHVKLLRAKLRAIDPADDPIKTHRGFGYSLKEYR